LRDINEAIVVGAGPNGLAAAIVLARAGRSVPVLEGRETVGGGVRSAELTLPGFVHDVCSAVHPLAIASPFLRELPLGDYGLEWIHPEAPLAHPFDDGSAAVLERSIWQTGETLGPDADAYRRLMGPLVMSWEKLAPELLGPLRPPRHPFALARFGILAIRSAEGLAMSHFRGERARALFAGMSAHSMMSLEQPITASFGLVLGILGHAVGWPVARGGSQRISDALAAYLRSLGGGIATGVSVESVEELPPHQATLLDVTPQQVLKMAGSKLSGAYRRGLDRYRYGPGVFKLDWALDGPIPWKARECLRAGTVHLGGTMDEIVASERAVWQGCHSKRPYVILAQPSLFDSTRAPAGKHTVWAYCHVPNGSTFDMTKRIEAQIERFAPGFRERVLAGNVMSPASLERYNPNYVGGAINGGVQNIWQLFTRQVPRLVPYSTPVSGLYICSSSTPPGGGVHGMCGYHAARAVLAAPRGIASDLRATQGSRHPGVETSVGRPGTTH
jgi:phytoene dehydrogenase-like protein